MNYKHLHYFWTVLRAGGVVRASEQLHLTAQTLSGQIKLLEQRLGQPLLRKAGRGVEPTDAGRLVMRYADEIFALGAALQEALDSGRDLRRATLLRVGIADALPKAIAFHVLEPAMALPDPPQLVCHEGGLTSLLAELACGMRHRKSGDVVYYNRNFHIEPTNICVFKGENHELSRSGRPRPRLTRLRKMTEWFDRFLKTKE